MTMLDEDDSCELLLPLTKDRRDHPFLVVDLESKRDAEDLAGFTRPFLAGVFDGQGYFAFWNDPALMPEWSSYIDPGNCIDKCMRFLLRRRFRGHRIYAHNGGAFDFLFLVPWLKRTGRTLGFRFKVVPISSTIQVLDVWTGDRKNPEWRFVDSLKLMPAGLDRLGKTFGIGGKRTHDLNLPETEKRLWMAYNARDCRLLYEVVTAFHAHVKELGGEVGITAASTSMKLFRRSFLKSGIHREKRTHAFIRASYAGGRCEVFFQNGEGLHVYDITSSYPAAMLEAMPTGPATEWEGEPPDGVTENRVGFLEVDVEVPRDMPIPPLPVRAKDQPPIPDGRLVFPVGRLSGIWEQSELDYAVSLGARIARYKKSYWYEQSYPFTGFVEKLFAYRDTTLPDYDAAMAETTKLLLNSLYGKFAQKEEREEIFMHDDPQCPEGATPAYIAQAGGIPMTPECEVYYAKVVSDAAYIIPQISARITAIARRRLLEFMMQALSLGGSVYYCDTDGFPTNTILPTSHRLGELKNCYPAISGQIRGTFLSAKLYYLEGPELTLLRAKGYKGLPKKEDPQFPQKTEELFRRISRGETISTENLEKIGTLARHNFDRGPLLTVLEKTWQKDNCGKRVMLPDGSSRPFEVEMW